MTAAVVFSGQGAQYAGMGRDLYNNFGVCRDMFDRAEEEAGFPLRSICFDDANKERLNNTLYCQPCIYTHSAAAASLLNERGLKATCAAGLSLGEYTALWYSGALDFLRTLKLLCQRGRYMADASSMVDGVMSAVIGLNDDKAQDACKEASKGNEVVSVSNVNTLGQLVISGARAAVERAESLCKKIGAKITVRLPVSGPYHTVYMRPAADKLEDCLRDIPFEDMQLPVVSNVDGEVIKNKRNIVPTLVRQISATVNWADCVRKLSQLGADTFIEIGPGKTLTGFIKKLLPGARVVNVDDAASFDKACLELGL
ncbi:MAG: ACP S-malonyltransferase [Clostridiales bacterium]|jgi:[acyl-carrier-protein] S-malonyltransferase|nr:ACP S-malonyltransferase [Clostridiales bacterium]